MVNISVNLNLKTSIFPNLLWLKCKLVLFMLGKMVLKLVVIILELSPLIIHKNLQFKALNKTPIKTKNRAKLSSFTLRTLWVRDLTVKTFPDLLPLLTKMFLKMMWTMNIPMMFLPAEITVSAKLAIKIVLLVVLDLSIIS